MTPTKRITKKTKDSREVHFDIHSSTIKRFCVHCGTFCIYCGTDDITHDPKHYPECKCNSCGLPFHDSSTQADLHDYYKHINKGLINIYGKTNTNCK